jgi:hypothetical protein
MARRWNDATRRWDDDTVWNDPVRERLHAERMADKEKRDAESAVTTAAFWSAILPPDPPSLNPDLVGKLREALTRLLTPKTPETR